MYLIARSITRVAAPTHARTTAWYAVYMSAPGMPQPTEVSVRQFVNDSGAVTRGLREGRQYVLTLNGEQLAEVTPIRRHRFVPTSQAQAMFATAPALDYAELRHDLDTIIDDELTDDPLDGTGL